MSVESLMALGLATLVLLVVSIYANKHRSDHSDKRNKHKRGAAT